MLSLSAYRMMKRTACSADSADSTHCTVCIQDDVKHVSTCHADDFRAVYIQQGVNEI